LNLGSELTGGSVGAASGLVLAVPSGAVVGSILGTGMGYALKHIGQEVARRLLSSREKIRTGAVFIHAANKIKYNIQSGHQLRKDDFFTEPLDQRSVASEIAEGVLLAAQKDHEEKSYRFTEIY
jgi:hypothetical protein